MTEEERALLLAIAKGKLGDYHADRRRLDSRRRALGEAISSGVINGKSPLDKKRPKAEQIDASIVDANNKIETLQRLINNVEKL